MSVALTLKKNTPVNNPDTIIVQAVPSGTYTTGSTGDAIDFTASKILNPSGLDSIGPNLNPLEVFIGEEDLSGYYAQIIKGTTVSGWHIKFYISEGSELGSGTYPTQISGGVLLLHIVLQDSDR